jgi:hypothetical protein
LGDIKNRTRIDADCKKGKREDIGNKRFILVRNGSVYHSKIILNIKASPNAVVNFGAC